MADSPMIEIFSFAKPEPQGSSRAFVRGGRAVITSANKNLKPYRSEIAGCALERLEKMGLQAPVFGKHVPVKLEISFQFIKPASVSKKRTEHVVKPDLDKLIRSTNDALTGIVYHDDSQVVEVVTRKFYGSFEGVRIFAKEAK